MFQFLQNVFTFWRPKTRQLPFAVLFKKFQSILERNNHILEVMADMGDKLGGEYVFDRRYIEQTVEELGDHVFKLISDLSLLAQRKNVELFKAFERIQHQLWEELAGRPMVSGTSYVLKLTDVDHDQAEQAGDKMAHVGDLRNRLEVTVPEGFVVTTRAFFDFMQQNELLSLAKEGIEAWDGQDEAALTALAADMQKRILSAPLPRTLASQILAEFDQLQQKSGGGLVSMRSSAWYEDGEASFAGQYTSVLHVTRDRLVDAYRSVVASAYSASAWRYRVLRGYREHEVAMAVGCQLMVDGAVSGVLHTFAPHIAEGAMVASAARGLCDTVVDGTAPSETMILERVSPYRMRPVHATDKTLRLVSGGGSLWEDGHVPVEDSPVLQQDQVRELAEAALTIERFYKRPQDIEWSFDSRGVLHILQTRPLRYWAAPDQSAEQIEEATRNAEVIFSGQGLVAQRGVGVGQVVVVLSDEDLDNFPNGAILVARHTSPRFSRVMRKVRGIITDIGSPTGHMATIAREFRVPTLVNAGVATKLLHDGDEITLDTTQNVVYRGRIRALDRFELTEEDVFEESYEYRLLRRLLKHIAPLNLVDPHGENFKPSACQTYHDITRYIHENAVEELINLSERKGAEYSSAPKKLVSEIPLGLVVIDAGDGTNCANDAAEIVPEQIVSRPLKDFMSGIESCGMWCTEPVSVDLGSFMSSFTRTFCATLATPEEVGRNLVVVLKNYMNLNLRLGYHFNIVDAYMGDEINDNYIYFRFLGGVTEFARRSRRAKFVAAVLERFDFRVEIHGDLVVGRVKKLDVQRMTRRMYMLGCLVGYARQLDARMNSDQDVGVHENIFMEAMGQVMGGEHELGTVCGFTSAHPGS